jgi:hypothetical protein
MRFRVFYPGDLLGDWILSHLITRTFKFDAASDMVRRKAAQRLSVWGTACRRTLSRVSSPQDFPVS